MIIKYYLIEPNLLTENKTSDKSKQRMHQIQL